MSLQLSIFPGTRKNPERYADIIIPLSQNDSSPFLMTSTANLASAKFSTVPQNVYRAVVEIVQNHGGNDEFYWADVPPEYVKQYHFVLTIIT